MGEPPCERSDLAGLKIDGEEHKEAGAHELVHTPKHSPCSHERNETTVSTNTRNSRSERRRKPKKKTVYYLDLPKKDAGKTKKPVVHNEENFDIPETKGDDQIWSGVMDEFLKNKDFMPNMSPQMDANIWNEAIQKMDGEQRIRDRVGLLIADRYKVTEKISVGGFGQLCKATDNTGRQVAIKFENLTSNQRQQFVNGPEKPQMHLDKELAFYKVCHTDLETRSYRAATGFPEIYWEGWYGNHYRIIVMELLGPSLENYFNYCSRNFRVETVYSLGMQMLNRVEHLHSRGFVHRDLKPENFVMGLSPSENTCYLIDFGLARRFRLRKDLEVNPYRLANNLVGTAKYASLNSHKFWELSRRDDLESLGYVLLEFMNGELPWKGITKASIKNDKRKRYNRIMKMKENMDWNRVCPTLAEWMIYVKNLDMLEKPDYERLRGYLRRYLEAGTSIDSSFKRLSIQQTPQPAPFSVDDFPPLGQEPSKKSKSSSKKSTSQEDEPCSSRSMTNTKIPAPTDPRGSSDEIRRIREDPKLSRMASQRLATNKFEWLERRDSSLSEQYSYQCLFRFTLKPGECPIPPPPPDEITFASGFRDHGLQMPPFNNPPPCQYYYR